MKRSLSALLEAGLPLVFLAACSSLPVDSRVVSQRGPGGEEWSFQFTNNTGVLIQLLEIQAGTHGALKSVGGFAEMAHATVEMKSTINAGETLHIVRADGTDEVLIIYRREGTEERLEARATKR